MHDYCSLVRRSTPARFWPRPVSSRSNPAPITKSAKDSPRRFSDAPGLEPPLKSDTSIGQLRTADRTMNLITTHTYGRCMAKISLDQIAVNPCVSMVSGQLSAGPGRFPRSLTNAPSGPLIAIGVPAPMTRLSSTAHILAKVA